MIGLLFFPQGTLFAIDCGPERAVTQCGVCRWPTEFLLVSRAGMLALEEPGNVARALRVRV